MSPDTLVILEAALKLAAAIYYLAAAACSVAVSFLIFAGVAIWLEFRKDQ